VKEVIKYLVQWKEFTVKHDSWEKEENLENAKELVAEFEERVNTKVRRQKKLDIAEEKNFRRGELLGKYMVNMLYRWDNGKFEDKYLRKLERNWNNWKGKDRTIWGKEASSSRSRNLEESVMSDLQSLNSSFFYLISFFLFLFDLFFLFLDLGLGLEVTSQSYHHTSVTLDSMVMVVVTSHKVTEKNAII